MCNCWYGSTNNLQFSLHIQVIYTSAAIGKVCHDSWSLGMCVWYLTIKND